MQNVLSSLTNFYSRIIASKCFTLYSTQAMRVEKAYKEYL